MTEVIRNNVIQQPHIYTIISRVSDGSDKNKSKKVIHFLKQEMSNIRQGMNKLIRAKSQQNIKFKIKPTHLEDIQLKHRKNQQTSAVNSHTLAFQLELKQLKQRVKFLQNRNHKLEAQIQQKNVNELKKNDEIATLLHFKMSLEIQNEALAGHIKGLVQHIEKLNSQNQVRQQNLLNSSESTSTQVSLNPQNDQLSRLKQRSPWQSYERLRRQYNQLVTVFNKIDAESNFKNFIILQKQKMIEGLNRTVITMGIKYLNGKYRTHIQQSSQLS